MLAENSEKVKQLPYFLFFDKAALGNCPESPGLVFFDVAGFSTREPHAPTGNVRRNITESLRKDFQNKIGKSLDAALQHFYITPSQSSPFHGRRRSGEANEMTTSMRALGALSAIVLTGAAAAGPARADAMTAKDILSSFNLVTTGNVTTNSDILGNAVVGGNFGGGNPTLFGGNGYSSSPDLYLFGKLNTGLNLNSGGSLYYAGSVTSPKVNFNSGGGFSKGHHDTTLPNPLGYYTNPLTDLSTQLSDLTASAGTSVKNGTFNAGSNKGIVVFDITGSQLEADLHNSQISFVGKGVTSYIINVTGNFVEPSSTHWNAAAQRDALFNFEDATTVEARQLEGVDPGARRLGLDLERQSRWFGVREVVPGRRRVAQRRPVQRRASDRGSA